MVMGLIIFLVSVFAGTLGSILGLGGGIVLIPALTLGFGLHIRYAVGASIISVIATSSGAAASYVRDHLTNIRLAIFLEIATTLGALCGVFLAAWVHSDWLYVIFAATMIQSAYLMWRKGKKGSQPTVKSHPWAEFLQLNSSYPDRKTKKAIAYSVARAPLGFMMMLIAGLLSGLLGIGSGVMKVLAMDTVMGLPIQVSSATSNFMIGVTAAASAGAYMLRGDIVPALAAPVALGVLVGSQIGTRLMVRLPAQEIRRLFVFVLVIIASQMAYRGLRGLYGF